MDILAFIDGIDLSPEGQLRLNYTAIAIDRTSLERKKWGGSIDLDMTATANQLLATATAAVKTAAADVMGEPVPNNARIKVWNA